MLKRFLSLSGVTLTLAAVFLSASITATANHTGFTTLNVNGEAVKIYRDDFGTPHIFAETNQGLFEATLDFALTGDSGVPPSRDYFNGINPKAVMSSTFDQALAILGAAQGANPAVWTAPRGSITFTHPLLGVVASIPNSNRATYGRIIVLGRPRITGETIFTLGQSGFIRLVLPSSFAFDPHFMDQLGLFRNFEYKPMRFFQNTQLHE
jgi:acyl-homoserine lactone acylase PvdQ